MLARLGPQSRLESVLDALRPNCYSCHVLLLYRACATVGATEVPSLPQSVDVTNQLGHCDVSIGAKQGSKVKGKEAGAGNTDDRKKKPCDLATAAEGKFDGSSPKLPSPPDEPRTTVPSDALLRYDNPLYREPHKVVRRERSTVYTPESEHSSSSDDGGSASSFASVISEGTRKRRLDDDSLAGLLKAARWGGSRGEKGRLHANSTRKQRRMKEVRCGNFACSLLSSHLALTSICSLLSSHFALNLSM
jgi:hypothetical protein